MTMNAFFIECNHEDLEFVHCRLGSDNSLHLDYADLSGVYHRESGMMAAGGNMEPEESAS